MAQVAVAGHHGYSKSVGTTPLPAPVIEMLPNPDFTFPRMEPSLHPSSHRRPKSMNLSSARPRAVENPHRRGASALPNFTFNADDVSGFNGDEADQGETTQATPSRSAHKRRTSEFVGGLGMNGAISSSPTRPVALPVPQRGHRSGHSRSRLTLSSHDLSSIMSPTESPPRLSSSLPNTPLEHPRQPSGFAAVCHIEPEDPFGPPLEDPPARPPSRPRVEFSENVEYIPRPLSTISSETESSMSTVRGHSMNNSISSVLSLSTPSPPSARARATFLETTIEDESGRAPKSSLDVNRRLEKEGQWLKTGSLGNPLERPLSEPASGSPKLAFAMNDSDTEKHRSTHKKRQSLSHAFGFDRRKSEPTIGMYAGEPSRFSALSLQEQAVLSPYSLKDASVDVDNRSSSRKLKDWAVSKLSRKPKEWVRPPSGHFNPQAPPPPRPTVSASSSIVPATAETDLDAVFNLDSEAAPASRVHAQTLFGFNPPASEQAANVSMSDGDDCGIMLDLDAALGPFQTPPLGPQRPRRELHSSRGTKDFVGPGGHYLPIATHRRTESAPMLTPFDIPRSGTPTQAAMADVFEEDEDAVVAEDCTAPRSISSPSMADDDMGVGVQIVDSDITANTLTPSLSLDDGLRIQHEQWEPERPATAYGNISSRLSTLIPDRRSSVIEDTIMEEPSPVEPAIVAPHEEPRAQSLTKSSDSSETPTILGAHTEMLALPDGPHLLTTPEGYQSSAFSSPDFTRRQGSFDTSRVGTSASSLADNRTMSSCMTGEIPHEMLVSGDDVPSLTSSRSTMVSTMHANTSHRELDNSTRTPSITSGTASSAMAAESRRKRNSIRSLSQLVGNSFSPRYNGAGDLRPQTSSDSTMTLKGPRKKEHRLKKLMFWRSKNQQPNSANVS